MEKKLLREGMRKALKEQEEKERLLFDLRLRSIKMENANKNMLLEKTSGKLEKEIRRKEAILMKQEIKELEE